MQLQPIYKLLHFRSIPNMQFNQFTNCYIFVAFQICNFKQRPYVKFQVIKSQTCGIIFSEVKTSIINEEEREF